MPNSYHDYARITGDAKSTLSIETLGFNGGGTTESGYRTIGWQENGNSVTNVETLGFQ